MLDRIMSADQTRESSSDQPPITLCTLHKAKETEFENVAITGIYEGSIPNANYGDIKEERRLCYVGMTRVKDTLTVTRPCFSRCHDPRPSRFIEEIDNTAEEFVGPPGTSWFQ